MAENGETQREGGSRLMKVVRGKESLGGEGVISVKVEREQRKRGQTVG